MGRWSARKSQLLAREYEKRGDADARQESGETKRYLPKRAWENMSEEEKRETEKKKREGSRKGEQYVPNTAEAKEARRGAQQGGGEPVEGYDGMNLGEVRGESGGLSGSKTLLEWLDKIEAGS